MAFGIHKIKISGPVNDRDAYMSFPETATSSLGTPDGAAIAFDETSNTWKEYNSNTSSWTALVGSGAGDNTLDNAYDEGGGGKGFKINADTGAVEIEVADNSGAGVSARGALILDYNDSTNNGVVLTFSNAGSGNDITADNWSVNKAGLITCSDIACSGSIEYAGATITGAVAFGADGAGHDVYIYSDTAGDWVFFDDTNKTALFVDYKLQMDDSDEIHFGAGSGVGTGDFKMYSDGTHTYFKPNAVVAGQALKFGDNTNELDVEFLGTTAGAEVLFDASGDKVIFDGIDLKMSDSDIIEFGDDADITMTFTSPDLVITAVADVGDQAIKIGSATNDIDLLIYGNTSGDYLQFDSSADQLLLVDINLVATESGNTPALDVSGAATGVHVVEINQTGALTNGLAGLGVLSVGDLATGGCVALLNYATGTPHADARILEIAGAGKAIRGLFADVDSTQDAYHFHCGGVTASGEAVFSITSDGTVASGSSGLLEVLFTGDDANEPILCNLSGTGTGINAGGLYVTTESDGVSCFHVKLLDAKDGAVGCVIYGHQDSATPAIDDSCLSIQGVGEDAGSAATIYAQLDFGIMLTTADQEDGQLKISCAAHDGSMTEIGQFSPRAGGALGQLSLGAGAGASYLTTNGAQSLILDTNYGTTTSSITLESGTNSNVILTPCGTGEVLLTLGEISTVGAIDLVLDTNEGTNSGSLTLQNGANGDWVFACNGSGAVVIADAAIRYQCRDVAAGTATDSPDNTDGLIQVSTNGATDCTVTIPEASSNLGLVLTFEHDADGGKDVVLTRTGADTIDEAGDTGNVTHTMANAGEWIQIMAVADNIWAIIAKQGGTLA